MTDTMGTYETGGVDKTGNGERKISSLRDLPREIAPPRDLWQGIEAHIVAEQTVARQAGAGAGDEATRRGAADGRAGRMQARMRPQMRLAAAAAMIATLAVGIWIGRAVLPGSAGAGQLRPAVTAANAPETGGWYATYVKDSKYVQERAELVKGLEARIEALPPESRAKVLSSLKAINDSKRDLEAELGKDPSNALLQELLVNTYQDEMRVLTAVRAAVSTGEGI